MVHRMDALKKIKDSGKKALVTFITAGDPTLETTCHLVHAMAEAGADLIELGIPFSDPVAEGPVIQRANTRALKQNITLHKVFDLVSRLRTSTDIPLVFLMYANSLFHYGVEAFFRECSQCGVDGVIVPDLPFEEQQEFLPHAEKEGIPVISLVSPLSGKRIGPIASQAKGFLYCVSSLGVTGIRTGFDTDFHSFLKQVRESTDLPAYLGFGISGPEQARQLKAYCDGIIVGSALVKQIEESETHEEAVRRVSSLTRSLRMALDDHISGANSFKKPRNSRFNG